jgi:hypothetical protein
LPGAGTVHHINHYRDVPTPVVLDVRYVPNSDRNIPAL